ncbi:hypothetical protein SAMN05421760_10258 [Neptunomonas antarctica]|uniref:Uncharacterized protein n=1 Tax=Neptunomonas antarctica TaxID=619304 RepID=A0A1N7JX96_9GAMM|nr:hypothetical protein SAMN05421760_10258 [Neptunomonas antarctica]
MSTNKPSALTIAIVTGVLTIPGTASGSIIKSFADINLERTKMMLISSYLEQTMLTKS